LRGASGKNVLIFYKLILKSSCMRRKKMFIDQMSSSAPLKSGKLTKKFLMGIEEGLFLVSNIGHTPLQPVLAEKVAPINNREYQWARIIEVGANNRLCHVFKSKVDYENYFKEPIVDLLTKK
jgi:hypothetical protein